MASQRTAHTIIRNISWNFFGQGWPILLAFVSLPYIVRHLNVDLYGIYTLALVVVGYFSFSQLGLVPALIKHVSQALSSNDHEKARQVVWACLAAFCVVGAVVIGLVTVFSHLIIIRFFKIAPGLVPAAIFTLRAAAVAFVFSNISALLIGVLRAVGRFDIINRVSIILGTLQTIGFVVLLYLGYSLTALMMFYVVLQAAITAAYAYYARKQLPCIARPCWSAPTLFQLLKFGGYITVSSATEPVLSNIEKVFLSSLRSVNALTYYSIPFSVVSRLSIIPSSVLSVLFPIFSRRISDENAQLNRELHFRSTLYMLFIYAFIMAFFVFFGGPFFSFWLGGDFARNASAILAILFAGGLIGTSAQSAATLLVGAGKPQYPALFSVIETVLYIPSSYLLIKRYGSVGAAASWAACVCLNSILLHIAACRTLRVGVISFSVRLIFLLAPPASLCFAAFWYLRHFGLGLLNPLNIAGIAAVTLMYAAAVWQWGMDDFAKAKTVESLHSITGGIIGN
jgi:O-antigen/teichoic acid export membrane protein